MIYADYNATTPVLPAVKDSMLPFLEGEFGNPSSTSPLGIFAREAVARARLRVAELLDCFEDEVLFVSGGTESCFTAILGTLLADRKRHHVITTRMEHPAVLEALVTAAELFGDIEISHVEVNRSGKIDLDQMRDLIQPNTGLISVMLANNEIGTLLPVGSIASLARDREIPVHTDATQAIGKIPVSVSKLGVQLLSLSGHKFGVPKGVGALVVRKNTPWKPLIRGGGQQHGRRGGTEAVAQMVALGEGARIASERLAAPTWAQVKALRDLFEESITRHLPEAVVHCGECSRLPNTSNLSIPGVNSFELVERLAEREIFISVGSACRAGSFHPSHVLKALGLGTAECLSSFRISFGPETSVSEMQLLLQGVVEEGQRLRNSLESSISDRLYKVI